MRALRVTCLDELTGLPEYRNGGLLLDLGVLSLRDPALAAAPLPVEHEAVVEWRALTVALLDRLADRVRVRLQRPDLPLARILEGGTWAAGRRVAAELRPRWRPAAPHRSATAPCSERLPRHDREPAPAIAPSSATRWCSTS